jgi:hypothetical protein
MDNTLNRLPANFANKPTPGYGCADPGWCLLVMPNGDLLLGNPSNFGGPPVQPFGRNVLRNLPDKGERTFDIQCYANYPSQGRYCTGADARGNVYAGVMEPSAPQEHWFDLRRAAQ